MLDADESAAFDEAARHDSHLKSATREMDRLQASVALVASRPVMPREGHLERIQARLGQQPKRQFSLWFGISGWAAAAALALLLVWNAKIIPVFSSNSASAAASSIQPRPQVPGTHEAIQTSLATSDSPDSATSESTPTGSQDSNASSVVIRRETERLTREIATLQDQVRSYQLHKQQWFEVLPGVATPVIMVMSPPGTPADERAGLALNDSPVSQLLVETLRVSSTEKQPSSSVADAARPTNADQVFQAADATPSVVAELPSAIPVYDAARDAGTLVVSNLPPVAADMEYNLWVQTSPGEKPVRLGILPDAGTSPSESFDFSLGTNTIMPSGFILTQDPKEKPTAPSGKNTVLQSPQAPEP
jgi:hypothetical protein